MLKQYLELPPAVHLLCFGMFLNRLGTFLLPFLTKYLKHRFHVADDVAALGMTFFGVGAIAAALLGGHFADQFGRKRVLIGALLMGAGVLLVLPRVPSVGLMLAALLLFALVAEQFRPALQAMIADLVAPEKRTHAFGLMYMAINLGFGIGPWIGGMLAERSFDYLFYGQAIASMVFACVVFAWIPETLRRDRGGNEGANHPEPHATVGFGVALTHILRDTPFLIFCAGTFCISVVFMQTMSSFPLYLDSLGIGTKAYGRIIAMNGLLIAALQIFISAAVARHDKFRMLTAACALTGLGFGLKMGAVTETHFMIAVAIWTMGEMMQAPLLAPVVTEIAPRELRARYLGLITIAFSGANALGAPVGGWVLAHYGGRALWIGTVLVAALGAVFYAIAARPMRARMAAAQRPGNATAPAPA